MQDDIERSYTADELCETVFYLARYAECLEIDKTITVPDERELLRMILDWAKDFEKSFDPGGGEDHSALLESRGPRWLLETFPYTPELDEQRQFIIEFIRFEESTSAIWPWALSGEEIMRDSSLLKEVERSIHFDETGGCDTDELYEALDRIAGVNPELKEGPAFEAEPSPPGMQPRL